MIAFAKPPGTSTPRTADELLAEFRATGAQPPFEELVRRYAAMVFSECYAVTKSRHDAEDAAQATFLTLAVQARTGDEIRHLGPWLQRVARRVALDQQKAKRRRKKREDNHHRVNGTSGEATPHRESMDQLELRHAMNEELQQLPAKYRMPLILHYFGGLTREQMAAELKCKPATLGVRLFRARDMLGKRLAKRGIALPAIAIPFGIACVVRESVENHGVMAMAASASQIAEAAARIAAGQSVHHAGSSAAVMALAETASHQLVMRKVKAIVAAAAIGASALAAGGAEIVHKIANGTLQLPSIRSLFRDVGTRSFIPQLKVDASQTWDAAQPKPADWPAHFILEGPGRIERSTVSWATDPLPPVAAPSQPQVTPAPVLPRPAIASNTGPRLAPIGSDTRSEGPVLPLAAPPRSAVASRTESDPAVRLATPSAPPESKVITASSEGSSHAGGGGGGGGGGGSSHPAFVIPAVPPMPIHRPGSTAGGYTGGSYANTGSSSSDSNSNVFRGHGKVAIPGPLENNGVVIADGDSQPLTLDLTSAAGVVNTVPNPPTGVNGWYARAGGKLALPSLTVNPGTSSIVFGDDADTTVPDLVNSARLTFHNVRSPSQAAISLLAPDRPEIPTLPLGYHALTVWSLEGVSDFDSLDITARYLLPGSDLAAPASGLSLFYVDEAGRWVSAGAEIDIARRLISADGIPATDMFALLTAVDRFTLAQRFSADFAGSMVTTDAYLNSLIMQNALAMEGQVFSYSVPLATGHSLRGIRGPGGIPEPSTSAVLLAGTMAMLGRRRR